MWNTDLKRFICCRMWEAEAGWDRRSQGVGKTPGQQYWEGVAGQYTGDVGQSGWKWYAIKFCLCTYRILLESIFECWYIS